MRKDLRELIPLLDAIEAGEQWLLCWFALRKVRNVSEFVPRKTNYLPQTLGSSNWFKRGDLPEPIKTGVYSLSLAIP